MKVSKNKINNKSVICLVVVFSLLGCTNTPAELGYDDYMTEILSDYYINHLSYPKSGDEFCYQFYKQDSINDFSYIKGQIEFVEEEFKYNNASHKDYIKYADYAETLQETLKTATERFPGNPSALYYIYRDSRDIEFQENDSAIVVFNKRTNEKISAERIQDWVESYKELDGNWGKVLQQMENTRTEYIRKHLSLSFFTQDTLSIAFKKTEYTDSIGAHLDSLLYNYGKQFNGLCKISYKDKKLTAYCDDDIDIVQRIEKDNELIECLESLIMTDKRISFAVFTLTGRGNESMETSKQ